MKKKLNKICYFFSCICLCFLFSNAALAVPPANDNCTGAILVTTSVYSDLGVVYTSGNTTTATRSIPNPGCVGGANDNNDDIWYKFVAQTQTELLRVQSVVAGSNYVTLGYALYDGCGGTEITCNNGMATFYGNEMLGGLTPGNTYYIRFWAQGPFTSMTFSFAIMDITPLVPANDAASATFLNINAPGQHCITPQFYTTASATRSANNPTCNTDNDDDVWFQFICPSNAVNIYPEEGALISTGGFANMAMEIFDATLGISTSCTANYGVGSSTSFSGIAGHVYQIRIWTMGTTDRAVFSLCLQQGYNVLPANNTCATATALTVGAGICTNSVLGNLFNADVTAALTGNPSCTVNTTLKNDVWYTATVPASGNLVVQTSATHSAVNDLVLLAYTNNCNTYTQITCDEDGNPDAFPSANHSRISLTGRTPGEIIYFRVLPRNTDNMGEFSICAFDESVAALPAVSITDVKLNEGNAGTKQFDFTVSLSSASANTVSVKYRTADISATAGIDYVGVPTKTLITFNPGDTVKTVSITINGDTNVETNETFKVTLSNAVNAVIADISGKGTIKNDDGPVPALSSMANEEDNVIAQGISKSRIYPNPVTDKLNIELSVASNNKYTITIMDITGRFIKQLTVAPNQKNIVINTGTLSRGSYLVKIESTTENTSLKFIKQ